MELQDNKTLNNAVTILESVLLTQKLLLDTLPSITLTPENAMELHDVNKYLNRIETALCTQIHQLGDIRDDLLDPF